MTTIPPAAFRRVLRFFHGDGFSVGEVGGLEVAGTLTALEESPDGEATSAVPQPSASHDFGLYVAPEAGAVPAPVTLEGWTRRLRAGGWLVLALPTGANDGPAAPDLAELAWRTTVALQAVPGLWVHATTEAETVDEVARGVFFAIARRAAEVEPAWAPPRLWLPPGCRGRALFSSDPKRPRVAVVTEVAGLVPEALAAALPEAEVVRLERAAVDDPTDLPSKATIAAAHLVVELTTSAAAAWAASADVDLVTTRPAPVDRSAWPRQRHVAADPAVIAEAVEAAFAARCSVGQSGLSVCMIVKNEEADLERCLRSVASIADEIVICDTGSTDRTPEIARSFTDLVYHFPWADDFSWARNRSLERARRRHTLWMDADDVLEGAERLLGFVVERNPIAATVEVRNGQSRFRHTRVLRTAEGFRFRSLCHELPDLRGSRTVFCERAHVVHKSEPTPGKNRLPRNIRILARQVEAEPDDARGWYYFAREYRRSADFAAASETYERMLALGRKQAGRYLRCSAFRGLAICYRRLGDRRRALDALYDALKEDPRWAETYIALGEHYLDEGNDEAALPWLRAAQEIPRPRSGHILDLACYTWKADAGLVRIHTRRGELEEALRCARRAHQHRDFTWEIETLERLQGRALAAAACPICEQPTPAGAPTVALGYARCVRCGLGLPAVQRPETPRDRYPDEEVAKSVRWQEASERLADAIASRATRVLGRETLRILEVMPAVPILAARLAQAGHEVSVVDLSPVCAASPFAKGLEVWTRAWEEMDPPDRWRERFDIVVLVHALECMPRLVDDLRRAVRCLRPGGLVFSRHADQSSTGGRGRYDPSEAFWLLDETSTERLASRVGLELVERRPRKRGGEADCWFEKTVAAEAAAGEGGQADEPRAVAEPGPGAVEAGGAQTGELGAHGQPEPAPAGDAALTPAEELTGRLHRRTYGGDGAALALETGGTGAEGAPAPWYWRRLVEILCRDLELSVLHVGSPEDVTPFPVAEEPLDLSYFDLRGEATPREAVAVARHCDLHVSLGESALPGLPGAGPRATLALTAPGACPADARGSGLRVEGLPPTPESLAVRLAELLGRDPTLVPPAPPAPEAFRPSAASAEVAASGAPSPPRTDARLPAGWRDWAALPDEAIRPVLLDFVRRYGVKFASREGFKTYGWKTPLCRFEKIWKVKDGKPVAHHAPWVWDLREALQYDLPLFLTCLVLWRRLMKHGVRVLGGMETSSIPILGGMLAVNQMMGGPPLRSFFLRKQRKKDDLRRLLEGARIERGARVAIVDDILNKGMTKKKVLVYCRDHGLRIGAMLVVIDTHLKGHELFQGVCPIEAIFTKKEVFSAALPSVPPPDRGTGLLGGAREGPRSEGASTPAEPAPRSDAPAGVLVAAPFGREEVEVVRLARDTVALLAATDGKTRPTLREDGRGSSGYTPFLGRYLTDRGAAFVQINKREFRNGRWFNRKRGCMCAELMRTDRWKTIAEAVVDSAARSARRAVKVQAGKRLFHKPVWPGELGGLSVFVYVVEELIPTRALDAVGLEAEGHDAQRFGLIAVDRGAERHAALCGDLEWMPTVEDQVRFLRRKIRFGHEAEGYAPGAVELLRMRGRWLYDPARPKPAYF